MDDIGAGEQLELEYSLASCYVGLASCKPVASHLGDTRCLNCRAQHGAWTWHVSLGATGNCSQMRKLPWLPCDVQMQSPGQAAQALQENDRRTELGFVSKRETRTRK